MAAWLTADYRADTNIRIFVIVVRMEYSFLWRLRIEFVFLAKRALRSLSIRDSKQF